MGVEAQKRNLFVRTGSKSSEKRTIDQEKSEQGRGGHGVGEARRVMVSRVADARSRAAARSATS